MAKPFHFLTVLLPVCLLTACVDSTVEAPVRSAQSGILQSGSAASRQNLVENESPRPVSRGSYRVEKGDTLYSIAWAEGVDYRQLARVNNLQPPYKVYVGQTLQLDVNQEGLQHQPHSVIENFSYNQKITTWLRPARGTIKGQFSTALAGDHGVDIYGKEGESVYATAAGQVVYAGSGIRGYGNLIILKHNQEFLSAYAFTKDVWVNVGDEVHQGQEIATMGQNDAGKAELHFEIRRNGKPVNPLRYIH